jgi:hypothetical protein
MEENTNVMIDIDKILDDYDKQELFNWLNQPAYKILGKVVRETEYQWGYQVMRGNYDKQGDDSLVVRDIIKKQGQREGMIMLMNALQIWKKKILNKSK